VRSVLGALSVAMAMAVAASGNVGPPATGRAMVDDRGGLDPGAPWPAMRHDTRNTGASDLPAVDPGLDPWVFRTGRGIFATPVVADDGTVYIGSSDEVLYALGPDGTERWRFTTEGILDTAPALLADDPALGRTLVVGSGDEVMYRLRTDPGLTEQQRVVWEFRPTLGLAGDQLVAWWEGSPTVDADGTIYQGNTGGGAYAVDAVGQQRWAVPTGNAVWTVPALGPDGTSYWGSLDLVVRSVDAEGAERWRKTTLGFVASSPALSTDGTVFIGSFDGRLYALDAHTGRERWTVLTGDHIYSSPALVETDDGTLRLVVVGSADGALYGVTPDGEVAWAFDTGAPIRSSPALGRTPDGRGTIAYVGAADGRLYAVNAETGTVRWAFDTTVNDPALARYNELNGSPALGPLGVYVGGQSGELWFVPYDACLRDPAPARCELPTLPDDVVAVHGPDDPVVPTGSVVARLLWREDGRTLPAAMVAVPDAASLVQVVPDVDVTVERSGDGRYLVIRPVGSFEPGTDYRVTVAGLAATRGVRLATTTIGAADPVPFSGSFTFSVADDEGPWPLRTAPDEVTALELSRLAVPLPSMLNSVNQIGFDFYDWVAGTVSTSPDRAVLWVVGARRDGAGGLVADPSAGFAFPLVGPRQGSAFRLTSPGVTLTFTFGPVPLETFALDGQFEADGDVAPDASMAARVVCADVPGYEALLPLTGMCNPEGVIPVAGGYLASVVESPAAARPEGLQAAPPVARVEGGSVILQVDLDLAPGSRYPASEHAVHLLVLDEDGEPVGLDYPEATLVEESESGDVDRVTLRVPTGSLPESGEVVVMADVFPLARFPLPG
jgi:outer membrane protein assembly factor BamB